LIWFQREIKIDDDYFSLSLSPQKKEKTIFYLNYFWGFGGEVCGNLEQLCGSPGSHVFGVS
jgi:hypothetical protein